MGIRWQRAVTTVEVMVMLLAMSIVIFATYSAKISAFQSYKELIHRERAQLYAAETMEQLEALRLTRLHQNYVQSWDSFLGQKDSGHYELVKGDDLNNLSLESLSSDMEYLDTHINRVRLYEDDNDGFFTRLERRIFVRKPSDDKRLVEVSIYWGVPGAYDKEGLQQVIVQSLYADHTKTGFAL